MMKHIACLLVLSASLLAACNDETCSGDRCSCGPSDDCSITCDGTQSCAISGAPGHATDVDCNGAEDCRVECSQSTSCDVDCGGSDCVVTCPTSGCTVTHVGEGATISCGAVGEASISGTTATCP